VTRYRVFTKRCNERQTGKHTQQSASVPLSVCRAALLCIHSRGPSAIKLELCECRIRRRRGRIKLPLTSAVILIARIKCFAGPMDVYTANDGMTRTHSEKKFYCENGDLCELGYGGRNSFKRLQFSPGLEIKTQPKSQRGKQNF
jgi:hypothetical protein